MRQLAWGPRSVARGAARTVRGRGLPVWVIRAPDVALATRTCKSTSGGRDSASRDAPARRHGRGSRRLRRIRRRDRRPEAPCHFQEYRHATGVKEDRTGVPIFSDPGVISVRGAVALRAACGPAAAPGGYAASSGAPRGPSSAQERSNHVCVRMLVRAEARACRFGRRPVGSRCSRRGADFWSVGRMQRCHARISTGDASPTGESAVRVSRPVDRLRFPGLALPACRRSLRRRREALPCFCGASRPRGRRAPRMRCARSRVFFSRSRATSARSFAFFCSRLDIGRNYPSHCWTHAADAAALTYISE